MLALGLSATVMAQQPAVQPLVIPPVWVAVRPIEPPATPLDPEAASAGVTKFSFIAYGDTRSSGAPDLPGDGDVLHPEHTRIVDRMLVRAGELAATPFPVRFVLQSGDAVLRGLVRVRLRQRVVRRARLDIAADPIQLAWVADQLEHPWR